MFTLFLTAVYFAARETMREQLNVLAREARLVSTAALAGGTRSDGIDLDAVERTMAAWPVPPDAAVFVVDDAAHRLVLQHGPSWAAAISAGDVPAAGLREDADGTGRAYGSATDPSGRWRVVVGFPRRLAWDATLPIYRRNAVNAGWWYAVTLGAALIFLARSVRSMQTLRGVAARVASGDLTTPAPKRMATSELADLQQSMTVMITRVRELQKQVVRQERLAAIGVLVSGVAHEINNPLQAILGFAQVLQARPDLPDEARADLAVIQRESERASLIIRNLSRFTRQQQAGPSDIRLTDIVRWLAELWQRRFEENHVRFELDDRATGRARGVPTEVQQVALNFLMNAEYAVLHAPDGAARHVAIRTFDTADGYVRFEIDDNGPGVHADDDAKLFQPFFTTKPVGEGTGLGLSVSYGIIQSMGGRIGHEPSPLGGARFYFELPAEGARRGMPGPREGDR
jgi:signal transduction histidine kinase